MIVLVGPEATDGSADPPALRHAHADPARVQWTQVFRFGDDTGRAKFARAAQSRPEFGAFRRFSVHPVLSRVEYRAMSAGCAWFHDARYSLPGLVPSCRFGSCQHMDDQTWSVQRAPGPLPLP